MSTRGARSFDRQTGQVYTERTCKAASMVPDWFVKTRGSTRPNEHFINPGAGCSSLRAMSIRRVSVNTYHLTADVIGALPVHLAREIWLEIVRHDLDSFRVWRLFILQFGKQLDHRSFECKRLVCKDSSFWMTEWIRQVVPPSFEWLTSLTLGDIKCSRTHLMQLSRLTNLGVLTLGRQTGPDPVLEDSVVRAWARAASEAGAFARLRILVCRSPHLLTFQIFTYLREFPTLGLLAVEGYRHPLTFQAHAREHGWRLETSLTPRVRQHEFQARRSASYTWQHVYNTCFRDGCFDGERLKFRYQDTNDTTPMLDLRSGPVDSMRLQDVLSCAEMHLFARTSRSLGYGRDASESGRKRLAFGRAGLKESPSSKRKIRTARQQTMQSLISEFTT